MNHKIILCYLLSFGLCSAYSQLPDTTKLNRYFPIVSYENKGAQPTKSKRKKIAVTVSFFQDFSDTVKIYGGNKLIFKAFLEHDSTIVSSDYTGVNFTSFFLSPLTNLTIVYVRKEKYLNFDLNRKYPFYTIHVYKNDNSWVAARKKGIVEK